MRRTLSLLVLVASLAAACSRTGPAAAPEPADPRPLMPQVAALAVDPTPGGAIVRATGLPPLQGYWDGALVPLAQPDPTVLAYDFRAVPPPAATRVSTERSRYVEVAVFVDAADLAGIREIRVLGAQNAQAARR